MQGEGGKSILGIQFSLVFGVVELINFMLSFNARLLHTIFLLKRMQGKNKRRKGGGVAGSTVWTCF